MAGSAVTPAAARRDPQLGELDRVRARLVRPLPADGVWGWLLPLALGGLALLLRLWHLGRPDAKVFDEVYYAHDAWNLLHHGVELDANSGDSRPGFIVHPPLGKWMIAGGEALFGNTAFGWRFAAAVTGSVAIVVMVRVARRLLRSTALGVVAGVLLMFDGLEFVQSRTAMLDVFLMFWVLAAFGCLLVDRDDGRARLAARLAAPLDAGTGGPSLGWRPWRWAAGLCLGAATATKWDGLFWIPVFLVLAVWWDAGARRTAGADRAVLRALVRDGLPALLPFLVLPAVVYVASWTGWFISDGAHAWDHDRYVHAGQSWFTHDRAVLGGWLRYQWEIWHFHSTLTAGHPYLSEPPGWLLLLRPVSYYYASPHTCGAALCSQEVLGIGTPALWWASIPALVAVLWRAVSRLDWRAGAVLAAFAAGYLPWFWEQHEHRTMFLFYLLPDVPFMVLAVTIALGVLVGSRLASSRRRLIGIVVTGGYLLVAVANFGYLYPVLAAQPIPYSSWHQRMWFQQCDDAKHRDTRTENAPCWI